MNCLDLCSPLSLASCQGLDSPSVLCLPSRPSSSDCAVGSIPSAPVSAAFEALLHPPLPPPPHLHHWQAHCPPLDHPPQSSCSSDPLSLHSHTASSASPPSSSACWTRCSIRDSLVDLQDWQLVCRGGGLALHCLHRCCSPGASCSFSSPWSPPSRSSPSSPRDRGRARSSTSASSASRRPPLRCLADAATPQTDPASLLQVLPIYHRYLQVPDPRMGFGPDLVECSCHAHHRAAPSARSSLARLSD